MQLEAFRITDEEVNQLNNFQENNLFSEKELTDDELSVFRSVQNKLYGQAKHMGWHDKPREVGTLIALCHSEISEAFDGYINNKMDDHLTHFDMTTVELADTFIRIFDFAGSENINLELSINMVNSYYDWNNETFLDNLLFMHKDLSDALEGSRKNKNDATFPDYKQLEISLASCVLNIIGVARQFGLNVIEAIQQKHAYNAVRADHQKVNREKEGGKAF